jgi:uncharacterized protein
MKYVYDVVIVGSGPGGLGAAFNISENSKMKVCIIDKSNISSGGLRNDCKQNYTFPVGFPKEYWDKDTAESFLEKVKLKLKPEIKPKTNFNIYKNRASVLGVELLDIEQAHVGTDNALILIENLCNSLKSSGVDFFLSEEVVSIDEKNRSITTYPGNIFEYKYIIFAPGRAGFSFLQDIMDAIGVSYIDNIVDIGVRIETKVENYPIVKDYYDPKFIFPNGVRTFCTNSGSAHVVKEKYEGYFSVNGHAFSDRKNSNGLVNFAMLKTIRLTDPVASGHKFASILGQMAMELGGGSPIMQRIGDFRMEKRSKKESFNNDLYNFKPTLASTPGDISLAMPAKILRTIWKSLKMLDTIVPGILHPSTIIYYPEIKTYSNRPKFINPEFKVKDNIYMIGDGAGTSRGITAAWASGIRASDDLMK